MIWCEWHIINFIFKTVIFFITIQIKEKMRADASNATPTIEKTPPNENAINTYPLKIGPIVCPISIIVLRTPITAP